MVEQDAKSRLFPLNRGPNRAFILDMESRASSMTFFFNFFNSMNSNFLAVMREVH